MPEQKKDKLKVNGIDYSLVPMSARHHYEITSELAKEFGDDWPTKAGVKSGVMLLSKSLRDDKGNFPDLEDIWELPVVIIDEMAPKVAAVNKMKRTAKEIQKNS